MAIFPDLPGVEVVILMSGVATWEYADGESKSDETELGKYQASKTVSKYIESSTAQEFSIELSVKQPYKFTTEAIGFEVYVDGCKVRCPILTKGEFAQLTGSGWKSTVTGIKRLDDEGKWKVHNFAFAAIETTAEDDKKDGIKEAAAQVAELGEIAVWVYRKSEVQKAGVLPNREAFGMKYGDAVHEMALKGEEKSHGTTLHGVQASKGSCVYTSKKLDGEGRPIAIYRFKYRPRKALESLLVVAREPDIEIELDVGAPKADSAEAMKLEPINAEEKRLVAIYLAGLRGEPLPAVKSEIPSIKREGGSAEGSRKRIKREGPAEVIDLTGD